ncbi:MAG TPA: saccharopine dehydrogenase C-terminal domain-containing protein [Cytophagaceae bacterium]|jgi:saccharopine dehydrogenase-like NADP-dependent oxidoreductase|nr:saccharopine dehydrogenase C-terminal domain-containing protein [Cytophagaceae bacterium]
MKKILILGAGRSSSALITYLLDKAASNDWQLIVTDTSAELAEEKIKGNKNGKAVKLDISQQAETGKLISETDLVISLLPLDFHLPIAKACLAASKTLLTASYLSPEIQTLDTEASQKGIAILMEMGLDPGIDHMSALAEINNIQKKGGKITGFRSYTGGLVAPESDNNPWHYKVTWNPRNVVLAGQGTVKYLENGKFKFIPYHRLFSRIEKIEIEQYGDFEGYANRDSLHYIKTYGLEHVQTFIRGTLRKKGYCSAWNCLVQLGMTDDSYMVENSTGMTYKELTASFLDDSNINTVQRILCRYLNISESSDEMIKLKWLGIFSNDKIGINGTPAQIIQQLITKKWKLNPEDKDMIVMQHQFEYDMNGKPGKTISSLVVKGEDQQNTAMAKTVGLPLAITAMLILQDKLKIKGVKIPTEPEIYLPVLAELKTLGIEFKTEEK